MATGLVSYVLGVPPAKQMGCLGRLDGGHPRYIQNQHNGHIELDVSSHHPLGAPLLPTSRPVEWLWRYKNRVHFFVLWNDPEVVSRPTGALCGGRWGVVPGRGALRRWDGGRLGGGAGRGAGMAGVLAG